jgi:6-phosphogluconolactonase (cycloisomerase 2 family)
MQSQNRIAALIIMALTLAALSSAWAVGASPPNVTGRAIVAVSDGDMLATAYHDQQLPPTDARVVDTVSITRLPLSGAPKPTAVIEASNAVTAAPFPADVAPDGRFAFVVETLGQAAAQATQLADLSPGRRLLSIDLTAIDRPAVRDHLDLPSRPMTVDVHPAGELLAVTTASSGQEIVLMPVDDGRFGQPVTLALEALGVVPDAALPGHGMAAGYAEWHPTGRYLAVTLHMRDEVALFELRRDEAFGALSLSPWGNRVTVGGGDPYSGHFTPDGRFFITSDWGRNFRVTTLEERLPQTPGVVSVIAVAPAGTPREQATHRLVSTADSDLSPEGIAISPDGALVVTINMRDAGFPAGSSRFDPQSAASLSLFTLNKMTGDLRKIGDYRFAGVLPENAAFDVTGEHVVVAVYQDIHGPQSKGRLDIWRVAREPRISLEHTGDAIEVPRGVHHVLVVP